MSEENLTEFLNEIAENLGVHAHLTLVSDRGVSRLVYTAPEKQEEQATAIALFQADVASRVPSNDITGLTMRTLIVSDPDGGPGLCVVRGYVAHPDGWVKLPEDLMREFYTYDDSGDTLSEAPNVVYA